VVVLKLREGGRQRGREGGMKGAAARDGAAVIIFFFITLKPRVEIYKSL